MSCSKIKRRVEVLQMELERNHSLETLNITFISFVPYSKNTNIDALKIEILFFNFANHFPIEGDFKPLMDR